MNSVEILAPAGSYESLEAAVLCGADAVYLGVSSFNARRNAKNFDFDELKKAIDFCHERGVRVHLTLNTLVTDNELEEAVSVAQKATLCGIDAIIVQDVGLADILRKVIPETQLHASTQMSVQTDEGIKFLADCGFTRAVLPRELSKKEILHLLKMSPIELEMFVHGALCMSVSGQCFMSAMLGQRSANRGLCAQPCRLPFKVNGGTGNDLSLKDNSLIPHIREMAEAGIVSFKIEGRMKRPEYVAAAVTSCRNALDGKKDSLLDNDLKNIFSRSGFTDGYYSGKTGKNMFGIRSKSDVEAAGNAIKNLQKLYEKEEPRTAVTFHIKIKHGEKIRLKVKCSGFEEEIVSDEIPQVARNKSLTEEDVKKQLEKCGGTHYFAESITAELDENIFTASSVINSLRREALSLLSKKLSENPERIINEFNFKKPTLHISEKTKTYMCFSSYSQVPQNTDDSEIFLPIFSENEDFEKLLSENKKVGAVVMRGLSSISDKVKVRLKELKSLGVKKLICPTIDSLSLAKDTGFEIVMGFGSNICNTRSLEFFSSNGASEAIVSPEITAKTINELGAEIKRGVIAYGKIPLMLTKNCPVRNGNDCSKCNKKSVITDRKGVQFEVTCQMGYSEILNAYPLYVFDKKKDFSNTDFFVLNFTTETREECYDIIEKYYSSSSPDEMKFTRGLYYRGIY